MFYGRMRNTNQELEDAIAGYGEFYNDCRVKVGVERNEYRD
ncbi:hypothetical protein HMPREF0297_1850 [Corynebacterium jeikeium ATCC 43734]|nr:hypothetical protein HMPREF0297_1850 [Corynebacterium jeikeium ATCC 43734]